MNLFLDNIIFALQPAGGISVYWAELLRHLLAVGIPFQVAEHPTARNNIQRGMLQLPQETIIKDSVLPLAMTRYLPVLKSCPGASIFHSSYYRTPLQRGLKQIVTVYDFTYEFYYSGLQGFVHSHQKGTAIRQAHGIICISESTRSDLLRLYPAIDPSIVKTVHLGISESFRPLDRGEPLPEDLQWLTTGRQVLFVGTRVLYKNFDKAVQTLEQLDGHQLVIIGGGPLSEKERTMLDSSLRGRYRHLLGLDETALNRIYNHAFCLLYPSGYEGFGFPPLEAMRAGCPVVAVRTSSLPEVCGDAGLLVESPAPERFAQEISSLEDATFRQDVVERGFKQAASFTWDETFRNTLDVYRTIAENATLLKGAP